MSKDQWMSDFYGKPWFRIQDDATSLSYQSDALYEWRILVQDHERIRIAQKEGFELVESFIEFESQIPAVDPGLSFPEIREAKKEDLDAILEITRICLSENDAFYTRLKHPDYFTGEQCVQYYRKSVENNFFDEHTLTVVSEDEEGLTGYYMLKKQEEHRYKGILTGVLQRARGQKLHVKMQKLIFSMIGKEITVINTTQLNNFYTVKNHMKEQRTLSKIEHIFYKRT